MRLIGIGLAMALALGALAPSAVMSADKPAKPATIDKALRDRGMKEAPPILATAGLKCTMTDARFLGEAKDPKTKASTKYYEVACSEGMGFVIGGPAVATDPVITESCLEADKPQPDGKPSSTACILPANLDQKASLNPFIAKTGIACDVDQARGIGQGNGASFFEVVCKSGMDYVIQASSPANPDKDVLMLPCLEYQPTDLRACKLSTREQQAALADGLATQAGKNCTVKDRRFMMTAKDNSVYYEVSCTDGKGYVLQRTAAGALGKTVDCINASGINGGCTLTDTRAAETEQIGLYTKLSKKAGFDCDVAKYGPLPVSGKSEVVELQCSNRPDGGIGIFGDTNVVYDCAHSELYGYRCSFTKPAAPDYAKLTSDLKSLNRNECAVSNSRWVGSSSDKGYVEVACADGLQGYMIEYTLAPLHPNATIVCSQATGINGGCKLAGNTKK